MRCQYEGFVRGLGLEASIGTALSLSALLRRQVVMIRAVLFALTYNKLMAALHVYH